MLSFLTIGSCGSDDARLHVLQQLEKEVYIHPDSVYRELSRCRAEMEEGCVDVRMRYRLLMSDAYNKLDSMFTSDSLMREVTDYFDAHGSPAERLRSHYVMGCVYRDMGDAPMAMHHFFEAVERADTLSSDCDWNTLFRVYGQMAVVYHNQCLWEKEIEAYHQNAYYARKAGSDYDVVKAHELMSYPYYYLGDTLKAIECARYSYDQYLNGGLEDDAGQALVFMIWNELIHRRYHEADSLWSVYEQAKKHFKNKAPEGQDLLYLEGNVHLGVSRYHLADSCFRRMLAADAGFDAYQGMVNMFLDLRNWDSIVCYENLLLKAMNDRLNDKQKEATVQAEDMYNYRTFQKQAEDNRVRVERMRIWMIFSGFLLVVSVFFYIRRGRRLRKQRREEVERMMLEFQNKEEDYDRVLTELRILQQENSQLQTTKEEQLKAIEKEKEQYQFFIEHLPTREKLESLSHCSQVQSVREKMLMPGDSVLSLHDKELLHSLFNKTLPLYQLTFKSSDTLTEFEKDVILLMLLGFKSGEISLLLGCTPQQVSNTKKRINRKMFAESDARSLFSNMVDSL